MKNCYNNIRRINQARTSAGKYVRVTNLVLSDVSPILEVAEVMVQFTLIPSRSDHRPRPLVNAKTAALEAPYAPSPPEPKP